MPHRSKKEKKQTNKLRENRLEFQRQEKLNSSQTTSHLYHRHFVHLQHPFDGTSSEENKDINSENNLEVKYQNLVAHKLGRE